MKSITKESILIRQIELKKEIQELLNETDNDFSVQDVLDVIYEEESSNDMMKAIAMFDKGENLNNILEFMNDVWNYFPHKILGGISPVEKLLAYENKKIKDKYQNFSFSNPEILIAEDKFYDYFLPSGIIVDGDVVMDVMLDKSNNIAFFLNLGTGEIEQLDMQEEKNKKLYVEMLHEIFAWVQIPRVDLDENDTDGIFMAYEQFMNSLPIKLTKKESKE